MSNYPFLSGSYKKLNFIQLQATWQLSCCWDAQQSTQHKPCFRQLSAVYITFCCLSDKWCDPQCTLTAEGLEELPSFSPPSLTRSQKSHTRSLGKQYGYASADLHLEKNSPVGKQGITNWKTTGVHCSQDPDHCTALCHVHGLTSLSLCHCVT